MEKTLHRLLRDRGWRTWETPENLRLAYPDLAKALYLRAGSCLVLIFAQSVALDDARSLLKLILAEKLTQVILVHPPCLNKRKQITDPARKKLQTAKGVHVAIFSQDMLRHPLVDHVDVPPHRAITTAEAEELLALVPSRAYGTIAANDAVVLWYGWLPGTLVAVTIRHGDLPPQDIVEEVVG